MNIDDRQYIEFIKKLTEANLDERFLNIAKSCGIICDLTAEGKRFALYRYYVNRIKECSDRINLLKHSVLPTLESNLKKFNEHQDAALNEPYRDVELEKTSAGLFEVKLKKIENAKMISTYGWNGRSPKSYKTGKCKIVVENFDELPYKLKKKFVDMQTTLVLYDIYKYKKELKAVREYISDAKKLLRKLDRLSEEEVNIYYDRMKSDNFVLEEI